MDDDVFRRLFTELRLREAFTRRLVRSGAAPGDILAAHRGAAEKWRELHTRLVIRLEADRRRRARG